MIASTWTDMVIGVDIHFEMVPTPAGPIPTPFPNPFIGIVYDPVGLAVGLALSAAMAAAFGGQPSGLVTINSLPATNVGTEAKGMGHILIPPGAAWVPMPKFPKPSFRGPPEFPGLPVAPENDAVSIMGSQTVTIMGSSAVRMGELWMSCGEPLRMPSSTVIAVPKGSLVLVGGPPGVNLLDAILGMIRTKWVAGYLHSLLSRIKNDRLRNLLSKLVCFTTGHPVDVASGRLITDHVDFELPGPIPLEFTRDYASSWAHRDGPLGPGWSHSLDQAVWAERGRFVYLAEDGREIEFDVFEFPEHKLPIGQEVYEPINRLTLRHAARDRLEIVTHLGDRFEFVRLGGVGGSRASWYRIHRRSTRDGHEMTFSYDARGNLEWVRDSAGRIVGFQHDDKGRLVNVKLPHPTHEGWVDAFQYRYDREGDLVQVLDPLGHSLRYAYKRHLMVQETDRNGLSFYFAYDGWNADAYCIRTWGDGGIFDHVIDYSKEGRQTVVTDSLGNRTIYKLNEIGMVVAVIDAKGHATKYEYDERTLRPTKQVTSLGAEITWEYDDKGNVAKTVGEAGDETGFVYDPQNALVAVTRAGGTWRWAFDSFGHPLQSENPAGETSRYEWHDGMLRSVESAAGEKTRFEYDRWKNLSRVSHPDGTSVEFGHDWLGRMTGRRDESGLDTDIEYDAMSRPRRIAQRGGNQMLVDYDGEGRAVSSLVDGKSSRYRYTGFKLAEKDEAESRIRFEYDTEQRLTSVTNEDGRSWRFELDERGLPRKEWGFDGSQATYTRGPAGEVRKVVSSSGATAEFLYDPAARLVGANHSDGSSRTYEYGPDGLPKAAEADGQRVEWVRDPIGRVLEEKQGDHAVSYAYAAGRVAKRTSSLGVDERFSWGTRDRLERMFVDARDPSAAFEFTYSPNGALATMQAPGAVRQSWETNALGRVVATHLRGRGPSRERRYVHGSPDRIQSILDSERGPVHLHHDARDRLIGYTSLEASQGFRLDGAGNRHPTDGTWVYDEGGRLLRAGSTTFAYDADGNLIERKRADGSADHYRWTGGGRLAEVATPDGHRVRFTYDALARRTRKVVAVVDAEGTERVESDVGYVWSGAQLTHEVWSDGRVVTWHWGPTGQSPIARTEGSTRHVFVHDHLGTPIAAYDSNGAVVWDMELDSYGRASIRGDENLCPWRWPGQYSDPETGLYYNGFRYFDPEVGRYVTQDPLGVAGGSAVYGYPSDPWTQTDPLGLIANHHPIPSELVEQMGEKKIIDPAKMGNFKSTERPGLWPLADTAGAHSHNEAHKALSDFLNEKHGLDMRRGAQHGEDWLAYLEKRDTLRKITNDFDQFYREWLPEQVRAGKYPLLAGEMPAASRSYAQEREKVKACK